MTAIAEELCDGKVSLLCGDCLDVLKTLPDNSVDACVTDPPYGLEFMGRDWDGADGFRRSLNAADVGRESAFGRTSRTSPEYRAGHLFHQWCEAWAREVLRVLKPGGHLLSFGGTRTYHRMACAIEDAGFEVRDCLQWLYGSGFPKSHDVAKSIDKTARGFPHGGADPTSKNHGKYKGGCSADNPAVQGFGAGPGAFMAEAGEADDRELVVFAREWQGWGTALKPACEMIALARKPLSEKTVAANVLRWGTGALNIDGCRIGIDGGTRKHDAPKNDSNGIFGHGLNGGGGKGREIDAGRWPANICHDGSPEVVGMFPDGGVSAGGMKPGFSTKEGWTRPSHAEWHASASQGGFGDSGSVARFFQACPPDTRAGEASADRRYTDNGSTNFAATPGQRREAVEASRLFYCAKAGDDDRLGSRHPTIKPVSLKQWLVRLVTPPHVRYCPNCEDVYAGQKAGFAASMREAVSTSQGRGEEMLFAGMCREVDGEEPLNVEGVRDQQGRIQATVDAGPSAISFTQGVHLRAPLDNAAEHGTLIDECRGGASQERNQVGQPDGEFAIDAEGRSRQTEPSETEHAGLSSLPRNNHYESSCPHCGGKLAIRSGTVLDCFAGTGTTGEAAFREGMRSILIEREATYCDDIRRRMALAMAGLDERSRASMKFKMRDKPPDYGPLFAEAAE